MRSAVGAGAGAVGVSTKRKRGGAAPWKRVSGEGGDVRGRFARRADAKRMSSSSEAEALLASSSSSSWSRCEPSSSPGSCSTVCTTPLSSSPAARVALACDAESMLSTLAVLLCALARAVSSVDALDSGSSTPSGARRIPSVTRGRCVGATTNRFAGVIFLNCGSELAFGVCVRVAWRRVDLDFGFGVCGDGAVGAMKRCGEGFCNGIVMATLGWEKCSGWCAVSDVWTVVDVLTWWR